MVPSGFLQRARVAARLEAGAEHPLTILAAPAGAGKSAALAAWATTRKGQVAWVSLDGPDADRHSFWRLVLTALRHAGETDPVPGLAIHPGEPVDIVLPELLAALERHRDAVTLVLDDMHRSSSPEIYSDLDQLLRHPVPTLRLVISTRVDPQIGVERLRVAGQVVELRARDLAFTLDETMALLELLEIELADDDVEVLWRRTEGWAAGLRLAATTLADRPDPQRFVNEFAGDDANVAEYLLAEVLAGEQPATRDFLIRASVAEELPVELAVELTGRSDSWQLLDELTHRHAFLAPVGEHRDVYRFHTLFAELLRAQLAYERPDEVAPLNDRAAHWYARHGAPIAALRHAVESDDDALAAELARVCWAEALATGEFSMLRSLVAQVGATRLERDPEYALAYAASLVEGGHDAHVEHYLSVAEETASTLSAERRRQFDVAHAAVMLYRGRARGDLTMAKQAAERLLDDAEVPRVVSHDEAIRALALSTLGIVELWHGDFEVGVRHLDRALAVATEAELEWVRLLCNAYLALGSLLAGRLGACELRARSTLSTAVERGWSRSTPAGVALTVLACVQFHWNLIDEADVTLGRADVALVGNREPPLLALHRLTRARVRAAQGRMGEALEELERALERLSQWPAGVDLRSLIETETAIIRAALGERDVAERDLERAAAEAPAPTIGLARLALSAGDAAAALEYLDRALRWSGRLSVSQQIEGWVLTALAHDALADHPEASSAIERALELAEPGGFRQPLLAHGAAVRPVLRRQIRFGTAHRAMVDELLHALELATERASNRQALPEQLTDREAAVLRFLPTMMSNHEIGSELFVSVNTVKTHLRSIYRKLGAADRREAVSRARDFHLLAPGLSRR